tara:strand:- start:1824 stop:2294 length:471 start_codon:yes stop_codon:yes gene_type:complete
MSLSEMKFVKARRYFKNKHQPLNDMPKSKPSWTINSNERYISVSGIKSFHRWEGNVQNWVIKWYESPHQKKPKFFLVDDPNSTIYFERKVNRILKRKVIIRRPKTQTKTQTKTQIKSQTQTQPQTKSQTKLKKKIVKRKIIKKSSKPRKKLTYIKV